MTSMLLSQHMELMLQLVWTRLGEKLADDRSVVLDTHFMQHLLDDEAKLKQKRSKKFKWHKNLQAIVNGVYANRSGKTRWLVDVDRVYTPMNWSGNHWVALCIDFTTGYITVYDSFIDLHPEEEAVEIMAPVLQTLPLLIADLVPRAVADYEAPTTWAFKRPTAVSQNVRTGDCGPLAVKYIELVCQGFPVGGITEEMVDNLRLNYAIDVYETFYTAIF